MEDEFEGYTEVFNQDGVLLKQAQSNFIHLLNLSGTLYIWAWKEGEGENRRLFMEWKPNDITVDSDIQDQEWAVVNTVQKRDRTLSGHYPPDYDCRLKSFKVPFSYVKSYRIAKQNREMTFLDGPSDPICTFVFQHGNCNSLHNALRCMLPIGASKRDKHLFVIYEADSSEYLEMTRVFEALDMPNDTPSLRSTLEDFKQHPYEKSMEAFSRITNLVYRSTEPDSGLQLPQAQDDLNRSLSEIDERTHSSSEYEVIQKLHQLPKRKDFPRCRPLTEEQWRCQFNFDGQLEDVDSIKNLIFRGGVSPSIRKIVWKFLLDYYPWKSTSNERTKLVQSKSSEYITMKLQWKSMSKTQEGNFADFAQRKSLIEKDVNRTDRNLEYYAGDDNANLEKLNDILMTYVMYNFDLGYVQGMSDLLSPILMLLEDEVDAFWCFVGFMNKMVSNFDIDQAGTKEQLGNLFTLLSFVDPGLASYLDSHDCANMFFCFRWLLVWFKRELTQHEVMQFWEILWTGYPCQNFHLLVAVAILEKERSALMENDYGFTEILKYINELSFHLDMNDILNRAEGIFFQIKEADHLTDNIRLILGILPLVGNQNLDSRSTTPADYRDERAMSSSPPRCSVDHVNISPEESFEHSIHMNFL